jgi:hypothetical protein
MDMAWVELIPLTIGAAILPAYIVVVLFLLRSGGVPTATAFVAGAFAVRVLQGVLLGGVFTAPTEADDGSDGNLVTSTLLLVVGILLLVAAVRQWRQTEDPDAPPPKWMATFQGLSPPKAFGIGAFLAAVSVKMWVFTLSALAVICQAPWTRRDSVVAYLLFILASQSSLLAPIFVCAVAPRKSARVLDAAQGFLERNNRTIVILFSTILGTWFLWKGVTGLT